MYLLVFIFLMLSYYVALNESVLSFSHDCITAMNYKHYFTPPYLSVPFSILFFTPLAQQQLP